jgi:Clostripain family
MTADTWNLLVYAIAGDTSEHQTVLDAIDDMRAALTSDRCHIAVQVMARGKTTRYWIAADDKIETDQLPEWVDAGHQAPLTAFLAAANQRFHAAASALVLLAHGSGLDHIHDYPHHHGHGGLGGGVHLVEPTGRPAPPIIAPPAAPPDRYGCRWGPDPNTGHYLTNVTMKKAIAASPHGRVDLLGLNACWMATLEIEYELRHVAGAIVASQVYAKPWPYRAIAAALSRRPGQSAEQLAQAIVTAVGAEIAADQRQDTVSAFQAGGAMDDLADAFDRFARRATELIASDWDRVCEAVLGGAQRIDDPYQVDLASLVKVVGVADREAHDLAHAVTAQLSAMRIGHAAHHAHPGVQGLSIFCPKSTEVDLADAYAGTEFRTNGWAGFLAAFQRRLAKTPD